MLKIYNTKTRKTENFEPVNSNEVNIYVCGPTVYSDIHIGNARPVIFFDVLKNYLEYKKYQVKYVSNITDIDDKIIDQAKKRNITEAELTDFYTDAFIKASIEVGSKLPDLMPKATDYIPQMITYIQTLINKDYAYATNSGVYFNTNKLSSYGEISNQKLQQLEESVRIENNSDKRDFRDFTLWKTTTDGISFASPWGQGRPGWHTECAVMNHEIFNGVIDIHGGGTDLIFPHHENENAQTHAHSDHELAKYWMHVGRVDFDNEKMSKSIGNTVLVKDLTNPLSYRLLILAHHYRNPINFSNELLLEFTQMYDKIVRIIKKIMIEAKNSNHHNNVSQKHLDDFTYEMDNDLNTPNVITIILELLKEINKAQSFDERITFFNTLNIILKTLSLSYDIWPSNEVLKMYSDWENARLNKDFKLADTLRNTLTEMGWM